MSAPALNVALLGSGIFATATHAPLLRQRTDLFCCKAIWSRSLEKAKALADTFEGDASCDAYGEEEGLAEVLARVDVTAVIICLPLDVQPDYVKKALSAGKHVLSEKPIAATTRAGKSILDDYNSQFRPQGLRWSVAENYRYEGGFVHGAEAVKEIGYVELL
jgi:glucose-fructose oxidoreductase